MKKVFENTNGIDLMVFSDAFRSKKGKKETIQFLCDINIKINNGDYLLGNNCTPETFSVYEILETKQLETVSNRLRFECIVYHSFESPLFFSKFNLQHLSLRTKDIIDTRAK